jgi:hypothetical protein
MAAPDPLSVRIYDNTVDRHRNAAICDAEWIVEHARYLVQRLKDGERDAGDARRIQQTATDLVQQIAALAALRDVAYLTTDPEAETPRETS